MILLKIILKSKIEILNMVKLLYFEHSNFNTDEIFEAMQTLPTFVTMGDKVKLFEQKFSEYLQMNYSTLVTN